MAYNYDLDISTNFWKYGVAFVDFLKFDTTQMYKKEKPANLFATLQVD